MESHVIYLCVFSHNLRTLWKLLIWKLQPWRILCGDLVVPHDFDTFRAEWEAPSPHLSDSRSGRKESWVRRQLDQVSSTSSTSSAPSFCSICLCWSDSMSAGCQYCLWETLINRSVIGLTGGRATHCVRECMCVCECVCCTAEQRVVEVSVPENSHCCSGLRQWPFIRSKERQDTRANKASPAATRSTCKHHAVVLVL